MLRGALLALILGGCVSVAHEPSPTEATGLTTTTIPGTTTTTIDVVQGLENYRSCLAEAGVDIPEIPLDALGRPRFSWVFAGLSLGVPSNRAAFNTCAADLMAGPLDLSADPDLAEMIGEELDLFSECMRQRGVDSYPDPVQDYDGLGSPFNIRRIPWDHPGLSSAAAACSSRIGQISN